MTMTISALLQDIIRKTRKDKLRFFIIAAITAVVFFFNTRTAGAFGVNQCAAGRFGSDLGCTAQDVSITGIAVASGSPGSCVAGSTVSLDLDVTVNFAMPDRWDIGIFLAQDGKLPTLLPVNGGSNSCSVSILPTPTANPLSPFLDLDGPVDTCGDGNSTIGGGTGSGVLRVSGVSLTCQAVPLSNGKLYIPFVVSWDNSKTPPGAVCYTNLDPVPNTKSKCNAPDGTVATEVQYSTVSLVVLPAISKTDGLTTITAGDTVNYSVVITNNTGGVLSNAVFKDPAVTNLTANSVACAAAGGAACPGPAALTVAYMQGGGITIPDMPVNSTVTFTVNATLSAAAPAGTLTNTASVVVSGQSNSASDVDTVLAKIGVTKEFVPFSILAGAASVMSITLDNTNLVATAGTAFFDTYPAGLVNAAAPGLTNTCGGVVTAAAGGNSLSLSNGVIPAGGSCVITVNVTSAVENFYTNSTGNITTTNGYSGNSVDGYLAVGVSSLLTSTKTWQDLNGGEADPGDVIRYTVTVTEVAGVDANGVTVTDTVPATLTGMTMVTCPVGATCNVAGQTLTAANVTIPANGTRTIVFDTTIAAGTPSGTTIDNCALIVNPGGGGAAPCASTILVSPSAAPGIGNKQLYLYDAASVPAYKLSRAKPLVGAPVTITKAGSRLWALNPALVSPVTISPLVSPSIPVNLYLATNTASESRTVTVSLVCSSGGTTFTQTKIFDGTALNNPFLPTAAPTLVNFNLPLVVSQLCAAGQTWNLTVANATAGNGTRNILVYPMSGASYSYASLPSVNVINVDSVQVCTVPCDATCANACAPAPFLGGATVYVRTKVSDPFGAYDINASPPVTLPTITIKDSASTTVVSSAAMTEKVSAATASAKWFEYTYTPVPAAGPAGFWSATATAVEGAEGLVSDSGLGAFTVVIPMPSLMVLKSVQTISDPVIGTSPNAKAIPGAFMLYTVTVTNSGPGTAQSVVLTDPLPANTELYVNDIGGAGSGPVAFVDGATPSGLAYTFTNLADGADSLLFSNNGGATYAWTPVADANGCDANVNNIKVNMGGTMNGASGGNNPSFSLKFRVRVK
ncbi:MAG: DUF11 domain-containing protein [Deltaproteobacteria bacterium]|nr:DUF11 domain-containing protein [Deltaproteobacteria bacterium]